MMLIIILNIEHCRSLLVDRPGGIELCNQKCKQICALCMQTPSYMNFRLTMSLIYKVEQLLFALLLWSHISNSETFFHIFQIVGPLMAEKSWFLGTYTCSNRNKCTNKWTKCHFSLTFFIGRTHPFVGAFVSSIEGQLKKYFKLHFRRWHQCPPFLQLLHPRKNLPRPAEID